MKGALLAVAAALTSACYHAPLAVPTGDIRTRWLAERAEAEAPRGDDATAQRCPASEADLVARAVARSEVARVRRAEARALTAAAEVPDAPPLGLRLTNFQLDAECSEVPPLGTTPRCDTAGRGLLDQTDLALRYRPARPGSIEAERDAVRRDADRARAEARDGERQTRAVVRRALAEARAAAALEALATAEVEAARAEVDRIRGAADKKAASDLELAAAEVARAAAEGEVARERARQARWMGEALALAGYDNSDPGCNLSLSPYAPPGAAVSEVELEARALASHPTVDARWAVEQRVAADGFRARAEAWPWLDFFQLGLNRSGDSQTDELQVMAGLEIELPIFQWGGEASDAASAAEVAAREATRAALDAVRSEVRAAARELASAQALLAGLAPPLDAGRLEALRRSVAGGYGDSAALAQLELRMRRLERQRVEAALAVEEAAIRLEAAVGAPLDQGAK